MVGVVGPATVFIDTGAWAGSGIVDVPSTTILESCGTNGYLMALNLYR